MTREELDRILRIAARQRPFHPYILEFVSGGTVLVKHPELVVRRGIFYLYQASDGDWRLFASASVSHLRPGPAVPRIP
ncbi:MAG: hypothetical protein K2W96_23450 [Gemmataceae bacterium]|nr:hypothetical protein [Gemmataceae bacterium]